MKPLILIFLEFFSLSLARAQTQHADSARTILAPLLYLASDQLKGRCIGSPGIDTAANYIVGQLRHAGARLAPGAGSYFQTFTRTFSRYDFNRVHIGTKYKYPPGSASKGLTLKNIVACIPGTDPTLRKQYIMLSAHYDHIGIADNPSIEGGKVD